MQVLSPSFMTVIPPLHLEIPPHSLSQWRQSEREHITAGSAWNATIERACLDAILPWLQERDPQARLWTNAANLPSFWELVSGSAIDLDGCRWVLLPTTAIDFAELRVPQEWVDLPSWAGDYYLSIYVNMEEREIQILGYTTHKQLKQQGRFDPSDRSYSLDLEATIADLNLLWLTRQLCPTELLRADFHPLPQLPLPQAEHLLIRLGNPNELRPRLAVPFALWGALLAHGGWRQRLYRQRLGLPEQWSLTEWFQSGISQLGQQIGWETIAMAPSLVSARGTDFPTTKAFLRQLAIAGRSYELRVFPTGADLWRFELHSNSTQPIPQGFKLRLLAEDLSPFTNNEDLAVTEIDRLYLEVRLNAGDGLVWEIEPQPDLFDREIMRF